MERRQLVFFWVLGSAAAMIVAAFAPWATVLGFTVQGADGNGGVTLILAAAITFFYGANIFFGIVFPKGCTSWEAHLAGALAGLAYARLELVAKRR